MSDFTAKSMFRHCPNWEICFQLHIANCLVNNIISIMYHTLKPWLYKRFVRKCEYSLDRYIEISPTIELRLKWLVSVMLPIRCYYGFWWDVFFFLSLLLSHRIVFDHSSILPDDVIFVDLQCKCFHPWYKYKCYNLQYHISTMFQNHIPGMSQLFNAKINKLTV